MRPFALGCLLLLPVASAGQVPDVYRPAVERLTAAIQKEMANKKIPALSVALVDDQKVIWSKGFGATDDTVYRVGSVSKLFTDVAVMKLVERGEIALDAPVSKYLKDFAPTNQFNDRSVTLRHLMAHRSGLIREPPVGNYFDDSGPTLTQTVASVNGIPLVYPPGEKIKYSNAAIGVVGRTLEVVSGEPFAVHLRKQVLDPLGLKSSSFEPTPAVRKHLSPAVMWTYHGREFPAPTFELGMAPAGSMYSTVGDLSKFASCLFAGGKPLLKAETVDAMFAPQFASPQEKQGFGIGFMVGDLGGTKRVGHGGAIYGFATELALLPEHKLAAIVVCSRDVANAVTTRLANDGLRLTLAAKTGRPLPTLVEPQPLTNEEVKSLAGWYTAADRWLELTESAGKLFAITDRGGYLVRVNKDGNDLIADDVHAWGNRIKRDRDRLTIGDTTFVKQPPQLTVPEDVPAKWKGLIGEYGWDHNVLYIFEKHGKLHALIEWVEVDPLTEESENVYAFPPRNMYHGEKLVFTRNSTGRATQVEAAKVVFKRRPIDGESGETFRIKPQKPLADLRREALAATPPAETKSRSPELVDLSTVAADIRFDIRYATDNNFLSAPFYTSAKAYLQKPAADALGRAHSRLKDRGYGLLVFDAYRPWHVTKMFWDATPEKYRGFVADPAKGSRHNRACAIDLGLYDLKTGRPVEMVAGFDEFSDRAFPDYPGGTTRQRWHRDLLRQTMEAERFTVYEAEWWHFDYADWREYPLLNKTFEELAR
jgi:CubicO group peptidase (beta-lactamase class C family)/D-alanyl-D-alanine dipeptidase